MALATVKMKQQTIHRFNDQLYRLWPDQVVELEEAVAEKWVSIGLAEKVSGSKNAAPVYEQPQFPAEAPVRRDVIRQDLRIAAMHGDTRAAVELARSGDVVPNVDTAMGTPPPVRFSNGDGEPVQHGVQDDDGDGVVTDGEGSSEPSGPGPVGGQATEEGGRTTARAAASTAEAPRQTTGQSARNTLTRR